MNRQVFIVGLALSLSGMAGCIGFPVGKDFTRTTANDRAIDVGPDHLTGKSGILHVGMSRERVADVAETLQLPWRRIDADTVGFWVSGWQTYWYLVSPEGGGTRRYLAAYEAIVRFDGSGRVVESRAENRPPETWGQQGGWIDPPSQISGGDAR